MIITPITTIRTLIISTIVLSSSIMVLWNNASKSIMGCRPKLRQWLGGSTSEFRAGFGGRSAVLGPAEHPGAEEKRGDFHRSRGVWNNQYNIFFTKPNTEFGQRKWGFCPKKIRIWRMKMVMWCARQQGGGKQQKREIHSVSTRHGDLYDQQEWGLIVIDDLCPTWLVDARQKNRGELNHFNEPNWLRKSNKCGLF